MHQNTDVKPTDRLLSRTLRAALRRQPTPRELRRAREAFFTHLQETAMPLLTAEIRNQLPPLYATEAVPLAAKQIICKFFDPCSAWTWYVVEGQEDEGDFLFWGLVRGHCDEWGYFTLAELQATRNRLGLRIERDGYFEPAPVARVIDFAE